MGLVHELRSDTLDCDTDGTRENRKSALQLVPRPTLLACSDSRISGFPLLDALLDPVSQNLPLKNPPQIATTSQPTNVGCGCSFQSLCVTHKNTVVQAIPDGTTYSTTSSVRLMHTCGKANSCFSTALEAFTNGIYPEKT